MKNANTIVRFCWFYFATIDFTDLLLHKLRTSHCIPALQWPASHEFRPRVKKFGITVLDLSKTNRCLDQQQEDTLGRWREYFKDILNPAIIMLSNAQEVHLEEENTIKVMLSNFY